jgi:ribonuclease T2
VLTGLLRRIGLAAGMILAGLVCAFAQGGDRGERRGEPGRFDFYVLALSWSPSYCEAEGDERQDIQCARPFAFVAHGLWPQWTRGWPQFCDTGGQRVPDATLNANLDIVPSRGLMIHQWRKHGSCSGLDPERYFAAVRAAMKTIVVPAPLRTPGEPQMVSPREIEAQFRAANPSIPSDAIAVTCDTRRLREVRVCFSRDLKGFVGCPEVDADQCRRERVFLPAVRGR